MKVSLQELTKQYASIGFNVEKRWINRLVKEKGLPRLNRGEYDLVACLKWYVHYYRQLVEKEKEEHGVSRKAEDRLLTAKAGREELKFLKERGDLVRVDAFLKTLQKPMSELRMKLLALGNRITPLINASQSPTEIKRIIEEQIYEALRDLADLP